MIKRSIFILCLFLLSRNMIAMEPETDSKLVPASKYAALELQNKQTASMLNRLQQALQQQLKESESLKLANRELEEAKNKMAGDLIAQDTEHARLLSDCSAQEQALRQQLEDFKLLQGNFQRLQGSYDEISREREKFIAHNLMMFPLPVESPEKWTQLMGTRWYELNKEIKQGYFNTDYDRDNGCSVERVVCFVPEKPSGKKIVIPVVHGTFATSESYSSDHKPVFNSLKNYAEEKGNQEKAIVVLLAFNWTGRNDSVDRVFAGDSFARLINRFFMFGGWYIHCIAHSHGGAVVIWASHHFYRPVEQVTLFATPVREHEDNRMMPHAIKNFVQFWSEADSIQGLGSLNYANLWSLLCSPFVEGSARKFNNDYAIEHVRNIRVLIDGYGPGHTEIKNVIWHLFEIEKALASTYTYSADLQFNLVVDGHVKTKKNILLALRENRLAAITGTRDVRVRDIIAKMPIKYHPILANARSPYLAACALDFEAQPELDEDAKIMKDLVEQLKQINGEAQRIFNKLFFALRASGRANKKFYKVYDHYMDEKANRLWSAVKGLYAKHGAPSPIWKMNGEFVQEADLIGVDLFSSIIIEDKNSVVSGLTSSQ